MEVTAITTTLEELSPEKLEAAKEILSQIEMIAEYWWILILLIIWTLVWKGLALWKAARNKSKPWFIVLLLVNTVGILDLIYYFATKKK
jgi:hypothetical protein